MKKLLIIFLAAISLSAVAQQKKVAVYVIGDDAGINKVLGSKSYWEPAEKLITVEQ